MTLRTLTLVAFISFSLTNFSQAESGKIDHESGLAPSCDKREISKFLRRYQRYFRKVIDLKSGLAPSCNKQEMSDFLGRYQPYLRKVAGEPFSFRRWQKALRVISKDEEHARSQSLIVVLCLCKILEEQIDLNIEFLSRCKTLKKQNESDAEKYLWQIKFLKKAILSALKFFFKAPKNRNLLPKEWKPYLFSLWEKCFDSDGPIILRKENIQDDLLTFEALRELYCNLWAQTFGKCSKPEQYDALTFEQLKMRILGFWKYYDFGDGVQLLSESGKYLGFYFYCKLLKPEVLDLLISKLNEDVTTWVMRKLF